ncbi:hypothetical protein Ahy_B02g057328 [Arachis hypogaea]|uniref:Uncharacterized protein n=1 Tax=Arachis hypogaea TaxID=3818 RepID=A0A445ABX0_ARAHY|nr:hypothetical protein Ahy_B02g057328 [Arachis hypogaea]
MSEKCDPPKKKALRDKIAATHARMPLTRVAANDTFRKSSTKEKGPETMTVTLSSLNKSSDNNESYDSVVDELYKPRYGEDSSEEEEVVVKKSIGKIPQVKLRTATASKLMQERGTIMVEDDDGAYDAFDGRDSWHLEEMKTSPNSENELDKVNLDEVFLAFKKGERFGYLKLEI